MAEPSVQLAQRLAANDKRSRDRALRKLRRYLTARSGDSEGGFTADEFCKIWKGLFYCMWMQDKPLLQEELALTMSQLVHALQTRPSRNLFIRTFWQTLNREWNGIDRLRLDKFYTLSRFVLRQSVELLKKGDWEESLLEEFLSVLVEEVLKKEAPLGVQHHLLDIYLDEVAKVGSSELSADMNLKLIEPFCKVAATSKNGLLRQSVVSGIFHTILDQSPFAIEDLMKEVGHNPEDGENNSDSGEPPAEDSEDIGPVLQFDYQALADRLFTLASRKNIPNRNRQNLYWLVKRFKDLAEGIFPQDGFPEEVSTDEDDDEYSSWRFRQRQKRAQQRLAQEKMPLNSQSDLPTQKKGKQKRAAVTTKNSPEEAAAKRMRQKNGLVTAGGAEQIEVNGVTHKHLNIRDPGDHQSTTETTPSQNCASRLKRKRRGCLLSMGLSVLPLRGAMMMRRRRYIRDRRKMISNKAASITCIDMVNSMPESPAPAPQSSTPAPQSSTPAHQISACQGFVTFQKSNVPKPLYVKGSKSKGLLIVPRTNCKSKKVTFSLNKNMTAEFKRTDRSLLVSPAGSSRVPFNPNQQPGHGVLKTPTPPRGRGPRARAADFF